MDPTYDAVGVRVSSRFLPLMRGRWEVGGADQRWLVPAAGLAAAVPVIVSTIRGVVDGWMPTHDDAYIAATSYDVFSTHTPLIGRFTQTTFLSGHNTYSPGPLLYWLLAVPAHFMAPIWLVVWMGIVNGLAVIGMVLLAHRRGGLALMLATGAAVAVMCGSLPNESLHDIFNPYAALLPFTLLLFLCWSIACGDYRLLPFTAVVGSFVVQCHLSVVLPALGALGVGVVGLTLSRRGQSAHDGSPRRSVLGALAATLVCWILPLIDLAIHRPGNLVRVAQVPFTGAPTLGLAQGWHVLVRAVGVLPWWLQAAPSTHARIFDALYIRTDTLVRYGPSVLASGLVVLILAGLLAAVVVGARRRRRDVAAAAAIGLVLCAGLVTSTAASPTSHGLWLTISYTLLWAWPAGMWVWLALGFSVATLWRAPATVLRDPTTVRRFPAYVSIIVVGALAATGAAVAAVRSGGGDADRADFSPARTLTARLDAGVPRSVTVLVDSPVRSPFSLNAPPLWRPIGTAIYALRRRGDRVLTPFAFYLGEPYYSPNNRRYDLLLDIRSTSEPPITGGRVIARVPWGDVGIVTATIESSPSPPPVCPPAATALTSAPGATPLHIVPGRVAGFVDNSQITGGSILGSVDICGWAANLHDHRAADAIAVFADGRPVAVGRPTLARPDVAASDPGAPRVSGFSLQLPYSALGHNGRHARITVYGIERGAASPLTVTCAPGSVHDIGC